MGLLRSLPRGDVALAGILASFGVVEGVLRGVPALWLLITLGLTLPLAWRRRFPVRALGAVWGIALGVAVAGYDPFMDALIVLPLMIVSGYTAGREATSGRNALLGAVSLFAVGAVLLHITPTQENTVFQDYVALFSILGGGAAAGHVMRVRDVENRKLEDLTRQLAAERDLRARAAVVEERARIARELHDIVAHSVSLIAVQAGAAEGLMARDPARARESLVAVQEIARSALGEMRRLLSVLNAGGEAPGLAPQPGLADVGGLVEQARRSGVPVSLREHGSRPEVPAGVDLAAFRIVQEALTNVRKHAGEVPTEVLVRYEPEELVVEVSNADLRTSPPRANGDGAGHANGSGHGIPGMRERTRIYGGTLDVGHRDGRYLVRARLPLREPAE